MTSLTSLESGEILNPDFLNVLTMDSAQVRRHLVPLRDESEIGASITQTLEEFRNSDKKFLIIDVPRQEDGGQPYKPQFLVYSKNEQGEPSGLFISDTKAPVISWLPENVQKYTFEQLKLSRAYPDDVCKSFFSFEFAQFLEEREGKDGVDRNKPPSGLIAAFRISTANSSKDQAMRKASLHMLARQTFLVEALTKLGDE